MELCPNCNQPRFVCHVFDAVQAWIEESVRASEIGFKEIEAGNYVTLGELRELVGPAAPAPDAGSQEG